MATPASRTVAFKPRARQQAILKERERSAYRPGILRTAALALVVIGLVSGLAVYAFFQRHEALTQRKAAEEQGHIANVQRLRQKNRRVRPKSRRGLRRLNACPHRLPKREPTRHETKQMDSSISCCMTCAINH